MILVSYFLEGKKLLRARLPPFRRCLLDRCFAGRGGDHGSRSIPTFEANRTTRNRR